MTFDASAHPRDTDGKFSEKTGTAPELDLAEDTVYANSDAFVYAMDRSGSIMQYAEERPTDDIVYSNTEVLRYAMDRHGKDWETETDRQVLVAQYTDEFLAYRRNGALDEGIALLEDGSFETYPRSMQDDAVVAAQDAAEDDVEALQKVLRLADAAENWNFHETATWLRTAVEEKVGADPRSMSKDADGNYVWDTETAAKRGAAHREAEANLRALAAGAADGGNRDYWELVDWTAQPERTEGELAGILLKESEDNFYSAVVNHQNATPEMLTYAARHNADEVKWAVAENPKAPDAALDEIEFLARRDLAQSRDTQLAWGTMKGYYDQQGKLAQSLLDTIAATRASRLQ